MCASSDSGQCSYRLCDHGKQYRNFVMTKTSQVTRDLKEKEKNNIFHSLRAGATFSQRVLSRYRRISLRWGCGREGIVVGRSCWNQLRTQRDGRRTMSPEMMLCQTNRYTCDRVDERLWSFDYLLGEKKGGKKYIHSFQPTRETFH